MPNLTDLRHARLETASQFIFNIVHLLCNEYLEIMLFLKLVHTGRCISFVVSGYNIESLRINDPIIVSNTYT